jgi:hypothetical protein
MTGITEDFIGDVHAAWQEHGREAIDRVVAERPEVFLGIVAKTIDMAYRSFREVLAGLITRLDTPPSINRRHPVDRI